MIYSRYILYRIQLMLISLILLDTDHEVEFRKITYEKFAKNKRHMIPRYVNNETIEILIKYK